MPKRFFARDHLVRATIEFIVNGISLHNQFTPGTNRPDKSRACGLNPLRRTAALAWVTLVCILLACGMARVHGADVVLDYSILDGGGGQMGAPGVTMNVSMSSIGGLAISSNLQVEQRSGFAGQLNDAPSPVSDFVSRAANSAVTITVGDLLGNDLDLEGDPLSISLPVITSQNGAAIELSNESIIYTPSDQMEATLTDSFFYEASDGFNRGERAVVTVAASYGVRESHNVTDPWIGSDDTSISFGSLDLDGDSVVKSFIVTNLSNRDLTFSGDPIVSTTGSSSFIVLDFPDKPTLQPGESTSFSLQFTPDIEGVQNAEVSFGFIGGIDPGFTLNITGEALLIASWQVPEGAGNLELRKNGTLTELVDEGGAILASQDSSASNRLIISASPNGNQLTVALDAGNPIPSAGLIFQGSDGSSSLILSGGSFQEVNYLFDSEDEGLVSLDDSEITYSQLDAIFDRSTAVRRTLNYQGGAEVIEVSAAGDQTLVDSTRGTSLYLDHPSAELAIQAGAGGDTVHVDGVGTGFDVVLAIFGGVGEDIVNLNSFGSGTPNSVSVSGDQGDDTMNLGFSQGEVTMILVEGGDHDGGDRLNFNAEGATVDDDGAQLTATGMNPVSYTGIESVDLAPEPELVVYDGPDTSADMIENGVTTVEFGSVSCGGSASRTFSIENSGNAALVLSGLLLPENYSLSGQFPLLVNPGQLSVFDVVFEGGAGAPESNNGSVSFSHNVAPENLFVFSVSGIVEDIVAPVVVVQDITVQLDASGQATITADQIDAGSSDNCGIESLTLDSTTFSCANIGPNPVLLTVVDQNGNSASASAIVTVEDKMPPSINLVSEYFVELNADGLGFLTAEELDNGTRDNCSIAELSLSQTTFSCTNLGETIVTFNAIDLHGNAASKDIAVSVIDLSPPVLELNGETELVLFLGESYVEPGAFAVDACDANVDVVVGGDVVDSNHVGAYIVSYDAADASGNASVQLTRTVVVQRAFTVVDAIVGVDSIDLDTAANITGDLLSQKRLLHGERSIVSGSVYNATGETNLKNSAQVAGNIESGGSIMMNNASFAGMNVLSGSDVTLRSRVRVDGDVSAAGEVDVHRNASVGGSIAENVLPPELDNVVLPRFGFSSPRPDIEVPRGTSLSLSPGNFGTLDLKANAIVTLDVGDYTFEEINGANNSTIAPDVSAGSVTVYVSGNFTTGQGFRLSSDGLASEVAALNILVQTEGLRVDLGGESVLAGTILAPQAVIDLGPGTRVTGALYGKRISLGARSEVRAIPAATLVQEAANGWLGMTHDCSETGQTDPVLEMALDRLLDHAVYACQQADFGNRTIVLGNVTSQHTLVEQ